MGRTAGVPIRFRGCVTELKVEKRLSGQRVAMMVSGHPESILETCIQSLTEDESTAMVIHEGGQSNPIILVRLPEDYELDSADADAVAAG